MLSKTMSQLAVCRICVADNVRMYSIADTELREVYENLTNVSLHTDNRSLSVCFVCYSQLRTTRQLMLKALKVEEVLEPTLTGDVQLSTLCRQTHKLSSSLSVSRTYCLSTVPMPLCNAIVKESMPEECVHGDAQKQHSCQDAGISIIKVDTKCDYHNNSWEADLEGDGLQSYDNIDFLVRRGTTDVGTHAIERKAPLPITSKLQNLKNVSEIEPLEILEKTKNSGTSNHVEEFHFIAPKTRIVSKSVYKILATESKVPKNNYEKDGKCDRYICNDCSRVFDSKTVLSKHLKDHTLIKLSRRIQKNMKANVNNLKPFACHMCDYKFKRSYDLKKHLRTHTDDKPYACHICDNKFRETYTLKLHMVTHTDEKPYACHICDYKCKRPYTLKKHLKIHTDDKPYACHLCDFKARAHYTLQIHIGTHTGEKLYACHLCDYKCKIPQYLRLHSRTHSDKKPYSCHLCDYKCKQFSGLTSHLRTHSNEKPYACNFCNYKCKQSHSLKSHLRIHSGEKPFACDFCTYKCNKLENLKLHMKIHTNEKPYACHICDYKCRVKSYLNRHLKIHGE